MRCAQRFVLAYMSRVIAASLLAATITLTGAEPPSADHLMRQMADRFEQASQARRTYVYRQVVKSSLIRSNGKVAARLRREYIASPSPERTVKTLGRSEQAGAAKGLDHDLLTGLTEELVNDNKSRDGIPARLFPLGSDELRHYRFRLLGGAEHAGRRLHRVAFEPTGKGMCVHVGKDDSDTCESRPWKGEVWIDAEDLQPIRITTELNRKIPMAVRMLLGTNLSQLGFSVNYTRVEPGIWFPASYGTEFGLRILWGFSRTVTLAMDSSDFRVADVKSTIEYASRP
jgi:hypothetical protein